MKSYKPILLFIVIAGLALGTWHFLNQRQRAAAIHSPTDATGISLEAQSGLPDVEMRKRGSKRRATKASTPAVAKSERLLKLLNGDTNIARISKSSIDTYLARNGTNAQSLLAAFHASQDTNYLRQAATNFPNDPFVAFDVVAHNAFPEDPRKWLDQFKANDPDNPLANYLSARDYLQSGQADLALQELTAAAPKEGYNDYTADKMRNAQQLYLLDGLTPTEAMMLGMASVPLPQLQQLRDLGKDLAGLQQQYFNTGDTAAAESIARLNYLMGLQLSDGPGGSTLIAQLVGIAIERETLKALNPNATYEFLGQTPTQELAQLEEERNTIKNASTGLTDWMSTATEADVANYFNLLYQQGETAALAWMHLQPK